MKTTNKVWVVAWWLGTGMMVAIRAALLGWMLGTGGPLVCLALVEGAALALGIGNAWKAKERDYSPGGLAVSIAYALGVFFVPPVLGSDTFGLVTGWVGIGLGMALSTWALAVMGLRFSVGGTAWVSLCEVGPYRYVRHPQLAARLMILCGVGWLGVGGSGLPWLVGAIGCTLFVVGVEERALKQVPAWVAYAGRVRWKLWPGLA